jgi:hypothetical protein
MSLEKPWAETTTEIELGNTPASMTVGLLFKPTVAMTYPFLHLCNLGSPWDRTFSRLTYPKLHFCRTQSYVTP